MTIALPQIYETMTQVRRSIQSVIVGQTDVIDGVLTGLLAGGHVLLESVPGLGKTLLVKTLGEVLSLTCTRVQFTPDVTPTDILGNASAHGPIFTNLLLADEINRAQPKTQAALLEAMQEHRVTFAGKTIALDEPFIVLATQNPIEQEGTYRLPEAQLDRFLLQLHVPYPTQEELIEIARRTTQGQQVQLTPLVDAAQVVAMQTTMQAMPVPETILNHASRIILATHPGSPLATHGVKQSVLYGASPRGLQALVLAGKAHAVLSERDFITTNDVHAVAIPALQHRLILNFDGMAMGIRTAELIKSIVEDV